MSKKDFLEGLIKRLEERATDVVVWGVLLVGAPALAWFTARVPAPKLQEQRVALPRYIQVVE